jgi:hypothetical protein
LSSVVFATFSPAFSGKDKRLANLIKALKELANEDVKLANVLRNYGVI